MKLHELRDNPGATTRKFRVGRGPGSGKGKTSGVGIKGQGSRRGVAIKGFEGGQMPLHRRLPKRGFKNIFAKHYAIINIGDLEALVEAGRLDGSAEITHEVLVAAGLVRAAKDGLRVLGGGELNRKLTIRAAGASASAREAVAKAGGTLHLPEAASETA